jgi:hypothetical protein
MQRRLIMVVRDERLFDIWLYLPEKKYVATT